MEFWIFFWKWFLRLGLVAFAGLTVVVTIGGLFDIRALLRGIRRQRSDDAG